IGSALDRLRSGGSAGHLSFVVAAWIRAAESRGDLLPAGHFADPLDDRLGAVASAGRTARDTVAAIFSLTGFASGDPHRAELEALVAAHLETLRRGGIAAALAALPSGGSGS